MQHTRLLIPAFGLVAIFGAILASGRLGESGLHLALGITILVIGVVGVLNVILFARLKAMIDDAAAKERGDIPNDEAEP
jgi:hypothetical protein